MNSLRLLFILFTCISLQSQVLSESNPYINGLIQPTRTVQGVNSAQHTQNTPTLQEISYRFEQFWAGKDHTKKGSGYKPFKRWEEHWSNYLLDDGTIAPASYLWNAWEEKNALAVQTNSSSPSSNWSNLGPAVVANTATQTAGQGRLNTIAIDPNNSNTIYVGAPAGGIWKSIDNGVNWTPLSDYLPQIGVSGIAIDPNDSNTLYISTGDDDAGDSYSVGVLKSTDGGATWNNTGLSFNYLYKGSNEIFIDPTNSSIVWVATSQGVYKSTDAGSSWTLILSADIDDLRLKPGDPNTLYAASPKNSSSTSKFYKITGGGTTITEITSVPSDSKRFAIEVSEADPSIVYLLSTYDNGGGSYEDQNAFQGVYKSTDSGATFTKTLESDDIFGSGQSWYDMTITVSDTDPDIVFVGVLNIWKSTDGGDNFTQLNRWDINNDSFTHADIHFMRYFNGVLYVGSDGGIYRSSNNGTNFEDLTTHLSIAQFYTISVSKSTSEKIAGGLQDCGGFAFLNNTWNSYHGGDGMGSAIDPANDNHYYGLTQRGGSLHLTTSGDYTSSQFITTSPATGEWVTPLYFNKNSELYAGYDQLYVLESGAWSQVSNHVFGGELDELEIDPSNNNTIYVSENKTLFKSTDRGKTFTNIKTTNDRIRSIEVHHTNSSVIWVATSYDVLKSTDGGATFTSINSNLPSESKRIIKHHPYSADNAVYLGTSLGVYYLDDSSSDWQVFSTNLPNVAVTDLEINIEDNTLTAATYGRGVWKTSIPAVVKPTNDLDLMNIQGGNTTNYACDSEVSVKVKVFNNGTQTATAFDLDYVLNGNSQTLQWTGNLLNGQSTFIDIPLTTGVNINSNSLQVDIQYTSDQYTSNNNTSYSFGPISNPQNTTDNVNQLNSFEGTDEWLIVGDTNVWSVAVPKGADLNTASGTKAYTTNPTGNYPNSATSQLVSPCFDLTTISDPFFKFKMAYEIEQGWDNLYLEYSSDKGLNWHTMDTWTGSSHVLSDYSYDLQSITNENNVVFRFRFVSDVYVTEEGVVLDDVIVEGNTLSIEPNNPNFVGVVPNPSSGIFLVSWNPIGKPVSISVFDVNARRIVKERIVNKGKNQIQMDVSSQNQGVYFIKVSFENKNVFKKIIIK